MPGKVRVKILAGRNLPVMDRSSDTTDAYVEIKFGSITYKTDVYRKSLNPQWNSDWYRFEVDDADLQDEPLQIRLMDHDTYSANDAIGKVNISLNPLLLPTLDGTLPISQTGKGSVMSGWIPVFDTMHGIRGEVNVIVKVDLFSDVNKFRQSSCGVKFFHSPNIPFGYHAQIIHGFVEELIVNDDPEYQWIDKIRTPRASNEARQVVFLRLSAQVQRKIGLKAIDMGANAVIGYAQCFDLEGDVGVVARGIGTAVTLIKIQESTAIQQSADAAVLEERTRKYLEFLGYSAAPNWNSKFDQDIISTGTGDIVHKILGIDSTDNNHPRTIRTTRRFPLSGNRKSSSTSKLYSTDSSPIPEETLDEIENLKSLLEQEDFRAEDRRTRLKRHMRRFRSTSKQLLNKKLSGSPSLSRKSFEKVFDSTSLSDRLESVSSVRSSLVDFRSLLKRGSVGSGHRSKFERSVSDGSSMTALLVRSLMVTTPSLDSISETNQDSSVKKDLRPQRKATSRTLIDSPMVSERKSRRKDRSLKHETESLGIPDQQSEFRVSDSNLSANLSVSSGSMINSDSDTDYDEDDEYDDEDTESNYQSEIVLVDADTVSMVVKSVLAQEGTDDGQNHQDGDWIQPSHHSGDDSDANENMCDDLRPTIRPSASKLSVDSIGSTGLIRTGSARIIRDIKGSGSGSGGKGTSQEHCIIEKETSKEILEQILSQPKNEEEVNWIKPSESLSDTDLEGGTEHYYSSLFHDLRENISEKLHHIHDHVHMPTISNCYQGQTSIDTDIEQGLDSGMVNTAMKTMLLVKSNMLVGVKPKPSSGFDKDCGHSRKNSLKYRLLHPFRRHSNESVERKGNSAGIFAASMNTILLETANLSEEVICHPLNNVDPMKPLVNLTVESEIETLQSPTSVSMINLKRPSVVDIPDITSQPTYGSDIGFIDQFNPKSDIQFCSLVDLKQSEPIVTVAKTLSLPTSPISLTPPEIHEVPASSSSNESLSSPIEQINNPHTASHTSHSNVATTTPARNNLNLNSVCCQLKTTNKALLLDCPVNPFPLCRCDDQIVPLTDKRKAVTVSTTPVTTTVLFTTSAPIATPIVSHSGHARAESMGAKMFYETSSSAGAVISVAQMKNDDKIDGSDVNGVSDTGPVSPSGKNGIQESLLISRRLSDSDITVQTKGTLNNSIEHRPSAIPSRITATTTVKTPLNQDINMLEYPFLTMTKYPTGFIMSLGGTVCARSVKLLERVPNPNEPETRDSWWTELRMEIRSHARALGCNVVLGYTEVTTISDDVCVLSVMGTAAIINLKFTSNDVRLDNPTSQKSTSKVDSSMQTSKDILNISTDGDKDFMVRIGTATRIGDTLKTTTTNPLIGATQQTGTDQSELNGKDLSTNSPTNCSMCHVTYKSTSSLVIKMAKCAICKQGKVPDVLLSTIELPETLQIIGRGCFLQAQVCRIKRDMRSESNAKEISDGLPFLEYEIYRILTNKLKAKGMNAIFGLKAAVSIGEKMIALIATGTAIYLSALPTPIVPKILSGNACSNPEKLNELQKQLHETVDRNREIYQLKNFAQEIETTTKSKSPPPSSVPSSSEEVIGDQLELNESSNISDIDLTTGNKETCILEVDDIEDVEIISQLMEACPPEGFHVVNTQTVPGLQDLEVIRNLQMFTQVWRAKFPLNQQMTNFSHHFQRLMQTIFFKLRTMIPCAICDLKFRLDLPESEEIQLLVTGMALGLGEPSKLNKYPRKSVSTKVETKRSTNGDDDMIFNLEEEQVGDLPQPKSHSHIFAQTGSLKLKSRSPPRTRFNSVRLSRHLPIRERYGVDITPLSYVPGGRIERYLGNLNFFFIRESTSIRENGGISGFVHSFITELLAVVRAHVTALGGNAMVSYYMTELILVDNLHKNQGQCLVSVGGDVVHVSYYSDD